jgi:hypothetical protein
VSQMNRARLDDVQRAGALIPRYWWLKRLVLVGVGTVLLVVGLRGAWGWAAERAWQRTLAELRAAGLDPAIGADEYPDVGQEENAAFAWARAAARLQEVNAQRVAQGATSINAFYTHATAAPMFPLPRRGGAPAYRGTLSEQLNDNPFHVLLDHVDVDHAALLALDQELMTLSRNAATRGDANWRRLQQTNLALYAVDLSDPVNNFNVAGFSPLRALAQFLDQAAEVRLHAGQHREAVDRWQVQVAYSESFYQRRSYPIDILVALAVDALACSTIATGLPQLVLENSARDGAEIERVEPATPSQLAALRDQLLDEEEIRQAVEIALRAEIGSNAAYVAAWQQGRASVTNPGAFPGAAVSTGDHLARWALAPAWTMRLIEWAHHCRAAVNAFREPAWVPLAPELQTGFAGCFPFVDDRPILTRIIYPTGRFTLDRTCVLIRGQLAERRLLATAIAVRLFEHDRGRRPSRLAELAPDYLPRVPRDPFGDGRQALRAKIEKGHVQYLYSRYEDGDDHGGAFELSDYSYPQMFIRPGGNVGPRVGDQVLLLDVPPPPPAWLEQYGKYLDGGGSADEEGSSQSNPSATGTNPGEGDEKRR